MNRNKEYRLKRKNQRKDYIIQDKNVKIKSLYYQNETKKEKIDTLKEQNRILKEKINTYENPEDLTLMFMYCDEKAKNKIKQLKDVIEEVRKYNNQIIKDTKDFYRPTEDVIYSGDTLIDLAETNIQILDKVKGSDDNE